MPTKSRKATAIQGPPPKNESPENIALPDFLEPRKQHVYGSLLKIRAKRLLDRDLTGALEAVCDLVADAYAASGRVLTEESINGELAEATVSLAMQIGLYKTNPGPYTGEGAIYRGGVKVAGQRDFAFDFKIRLRNKLDHVLAEALAAQADEQRGDVSVTVPTYAPREASKNTGAARKRNAKTTKPAYPSFYPDDHTATPRRILDRRRSEMKLKWPELHELVEKEYVTRALDARKAIGLERGPEPGFSEDSLLSIRRGCPVPQAKLEAVAAVISRPGKGTPLPQPIPWEKLQWREGFVRK